MKVITTKVSVSNNESDRNHETTGKTTSMKDVSTAVSLVYLRLGKLNILVSLQLKT